MEELVVAQHTTPTQVPNQQRLSDYLRGIFEQLPSNKSIKTALKKQKILVDNQVAYSGDWVKPNSQIALLQIDKTPTKVFPLLLDVLYEDDWLAVIHKPAGYTVSGNQFRTIENALPNNLTPSTQIDALARPRIAHRLDAPTTGVLLVAKTHKVRIDLGRQFEQKTIQKYYQALVVGKMPQESGTIDKPIGQKTATTHYTVKVSVPALKGEYLSWLDLKPTTGRTHQIRIHLAQSGCPILGDSLYGKEGLVLKHKGLFLLAKAIVFTHPTSQKEIKIETQTPPKYQKTIDKTQRQYHKSKMQ